MLEKMKTKSVLLVEVTEYFMKFLLLHAKILVSDTSVV